MKISPVINQLSTKIHSTEVAKTAKRGLLAAVIAIPTLLSAQSCGILLYDPYYHPYAAPMPVPPSHPAPAPFMYSPTPRHPQSPSPRHHGPNHNGSHHYGDINSLEVTAEKLSTLG